MKDILFICNHEKLNSSIEHVSSDQTSLAVPDTENLNIRISGLDMSIRTFKCLDADGIKNIAGLIFKTETELLNIRNFSHSCLDEIKRILLSMGLTLKKEKTVIKTNQHMVSPTVSIANRKNGLDERLSNLPLSTNIVSCLSEKNIVHVKDLVKMTDENLLNIKNFAPNMLAEIKRTLSSIGFELSSKETTANAMDSTKNRQEVTSRYLEYVFSQMSPCSDEKVVSILAEVLPNNVLLDSSYMLIASKRGYVKTIARLKELGLGVKSKNIDGWSSLMLSCINGHKKAVSKLLELGADVNDENNEGWTPLICAANRGYDEVISILIERGANIDAKDKAGWTAMIHSARNGHSGLVSKLVELKANINIKNNKGATALMLSARNGHTKTVVKLKELGANINEITKLGGTALMYASIMGHTETVAKLIEFDGNIKMRTASGHTALMCSAANNFVETSELLISKGADLNAINNNGQTALALAIENKAKKTESLLISKGADVGIKDKCVKTILSMAKEGNNDKVELKLIESRASLDDTTTSNINESDKDDVVHKLMKWDEYLS